MTPGARVASRYVIHEHIGSGGMQDVFLARDELLELDVAMKRPQLGQHDRRFARSAEIAARINHYNVAKTLDYFEEHDQPVLIEEYVAGETLEAKIERFKAVDPHLGARTLLHLAKGVAASHHAGVIHRDLKPSNVLVAAGVNLHALKITDFGIATLTEEVFDQAAKVGDLTKSTSQTIRGALPYMAPELMFRSPKDTPTSAADIWSVGALMFKLLTGEYPFGVYLEAAVNVRNRHRKAWPEFMVRNPQFKPLAIELRNIVERCLEYDASKRPSADALVEQCAELCFINAERTEGRIVNFIQNGRSGFAKDDEGTVFFSMESVYGERRPGAARNNRVCYSRFPGQPRCRGHPVVVID